MATKLPVIFDNLDYVKYLRDYYEARHAADRWFSYRYIQGKTGIDPGYLFKIFQGKKPLARKMIEPVAAVLNLGKRESAYFSLLVHYGNAKSNDEIRLYFEKLLSFREVSARKVDAKQYEYYAKWYYAAIRQVLSYYPFDGNFAALAAMTIPAITPAEARKAVALLKTLGFVEESADGGLRVMDRLMTTGESWHSIAVRKFQQDTIMLAHQALDTVHKDQRDISTVTVTLSDAEFGELKERIRQFRREILELANRNEPATGAYHVNIQMLPIGRRWEGPKK